MVPLKFVLQAEGVWAKEDQTGGDWLEGRLSYSSPSEHFFILEATAVTSGDNNYRGFVALDNFLVEEGMCDHDCNFDADISVCDWQNDDSSDDFDWSVAHGSLKSFTGPTRDQSSSERGGREGGYAYIDSAYPRRPGDRARMEMSKTLQTEPDSPLCLSFYVNMFGAGIGSLAVLMQDSTTKSISPIWEMRRPASSPRDMWHKARVTIGRISKIFSLTQSGLCFMLEGF